VCGIDRKEFHPRVLAGHKSTTEARDRCVDNLVDDRESESGDFSITVKTSFQATIPRLQSTTHFSSNAV